MDIIAPTEEFWEAMCSLRFSRIDLNHGSIGKDIYYCSMPPEEVDGFLEKKIEESIAALEGKPLFRWPWKKC